MTQYPALPLAAARGRTRRLAKNARQIYVFDPISTFQSPRLLSINSLEQENRHATALWVNRLTVGLTTDGDADVAVQKLLCGAHRHQAIAIDRYRHHPTQQL
jgi:hypothetical protein